MRGGRERPFSRLSAVQRLLSEERLRVLACFPSLVVPTGPLPRCQLTPRLALRPSQNLLYKCKGGKPDPLQKAPKFVRQGDMVIARLKVPQKMCIETFNDFDAFGRFMLRDEGESSQTCPLATGRLFLCSCAPWVPCPPPCQPSGAGSCAI